MPKDTSYLVFHAGVFSGLICAYRSCIESNTLENQWAKKHFEQKFRRIGQAIEAREARKEVWTEEETKVEIQKLRDEYEQVQAQDSSPEDKAKFIVNKKVLEVVIQAMDSKIEEITRGLPKTSPHELSALYLRTRKAEAQAQAQAQAKAKAQQISAEKSGPESKPSSHSLPSGDVANGNQSVTELQPEQQEQRQQALENKEEEQGLLSFVPRLVPAFITSALVSNGNQSVTELQPEQQEQRQQALENKEEEQGLLSFVPRLVPAFTSALVSGNQSVTELHEQQEQRQEQVLENEEVAGADFRKAIAPIS